MYTKGRGIGFYHYQGMYTKGRGIGFFYTDIRACILKAGWIRFVYTATKVLF